MRGHERMYQTRGAEFREKIPESLVREVIDSTMTLLAPENEDPVPTT